ncbi:ABC transporter ATP-binding protein [Desulfomonile tiedjei]|uniref:ABC-type bacteriocin/lantibiotic exporter with N-terminal double-glycine peptidase domain n=1 Tax=Desulfomonile tiedjei (strain ATCC 49306 / DSM 6799 / DCB-1) TaxID=706587 RepID=I4C7D9_DESTA|nr:ABC transporter ATP-binding protein [Desulfomonile tiedjei]AFM25480.1 ABC-type bacteriocin/lantibiotic exporter with N-terminal double-glycine peptidase domain [Desulfomonile tiedjei DSM 6799]
MDDNQSGSGILRSLFIAYPGRSAVATICLTFAALAEGVGIASVLPLISLAVGKGPSLTGDLGRYVQEAFSYVNLQPTLGSLLIVMVVTMTAKAILVLIALKQVGYTVAHVEADLRLSLIRALMQARWEYFSSLRDGAVTNAIITEAERAAYGYRRMLFVIGYSIQLLVYVIICFMISWQLSVSVAICGVLGAFVFSFFLGMTRDAGRKQTRLLSSLSSRLVEGLQCLKPLKAMACEHLLRPLLESEIGQLKQAREKEILSTEGRFALNEPLIAVLLAGAVYVGVVYWNADAEGMVVLGLIFWRGLGRIDGIQAQIQELVRVESAMKSLRSGIDAANRYSESNLGKTTPSLERELRLENLSFSYAEKAVIQNLSLSIPAYSFVALMGPSGTGKTTVADLITGMLPPSSGRILTDGVSLSEVDMRAWRSLIGYVPQESILFHDTIHMNVTLGNPEISESGVTAALKSAGAWDFVCELPDGTKTPVGERGMKLSGGQRQRIAIARAIVRNPRLLILDEVTSALDPVTEKDICLTLQQLKERMTIFAISHQEAVVHFADQVHTLERSFTREHYQPPDLSKIAG